MDDRTPAPVRVERTGIALVHAGELIGPDPDATAVLGSAPDPADLLTGVSASVQDGDVHFWFPVEIEVVGRDGSGTEPGGTDLVRTLTATVFDELRRELASRS